MTDATRETVLTALDTIRDPASGKSIVQSGMLRGLVLRDGHVGFALEVPAHRGPTAEPLRAAAEKAVRALPGVLSVTAVLTAHSEPAPPASPRRASAQPIQHGQPAHHAPAPMGIEGVASIIAVASGKGGVGKSTVAVNLALGLARLGLKTGLLDADIYGPSVPRLLDIRDKPENAGGKLKPIEKFGIRAMSIGFLVREDEAMIWRGPMVQSALTQMMRDVSWAPLDVLIIDMPPGTGDAQLTIAQRVPLKGAVIVSTPQDLALIDARKAIAMFEKTKVPVLGVVENMSTFICPHCHTETQIFGHGGAKAVAQRLGVAFLGEIPLMPRIRETSDAGTPVVAADHGGIEAQAFLAVAHQVSRTLATVAKPPPRIVIE